MRTPITHWTVDYGDGRAPVEVIVPHAWRQDMPLTFEGPAVYRAQLTVPPGPTCLVFNGVSYAADVLIDGEPCAHHQGIWDEFHVPLDGHQGKRIEVEVRVVKNGGATYPVRDVASGFLPYVYHTFGGIHGDVELCPAADYKREKAVIAPEPRISVRERKLYVDGQPFYLRGLLHWGWYPDLGHTNPPEEMIRREVRAAKALGFNTVKFCLWVPPHRYLDVLREEGMFAWMELPLWAPANDPEKREAMGEEIERIVRGYRHHDNIIVWTVGCELDASTPAEYRQYLTALVKGLTGCPLVKDNSGGAEMYGGDPREYGDFDDFHPYCDLPFYPPVLDSLLPGARGRAPVLLGEYNDIDVHRDLARTGDELPYWASAVSELNDKGVRWQYDLPTVIHDGRFSNEPTKSGHKKLMEASRQKAIFIRKTVTEAVRAREPIGGYVVTGWRDTPISSAGFFDDWGAPRFTPDECAAWNGPSCLFLLPSRQPPWIAGGNRPGFVDPHCHFPGGILWRVGLHTENPLTGGLVWRVRRSDGTTVARGAKPVDRVEPMESREVAQIFWACDEPGEYVLEAELGGASNSWPIWVVPRPDLAPYQEWGVDDPCGLFEGLGLSGEHTWSRRARLRT